MYGGYQGQYGQPPGAPGYGGYPGAPPGMGAPSGTSGAPGMSAPPGNAPPSQANANLPGRPTGLPPNFNPPPNFANINFNAPVIRLGTMGSGKEGPSASAGGMGDSSGRRGLGMGGNMDQQRPRENAVLVAPTREEVMRTIFIGDIPSAIHDVDLERVLRAAGRLRKWTRGVDSSNNSCSFGFAEFEDAESLENAIEVLPDLEVPATRPEVVEDRTGNTKEVERVKLFVQIDDASRRYAQNWAETRNEPAEVVANRLHMAKENVSSVMIDIFNPSKMSRDLDGDISMQGSELQADPLTGEIITIPLSTEDELADIPAEMRETVAAEIASFRQRSNERDMDRLKRENEMESTDKRGGRYNRLGSPPRSAPTGPSASNGVPLGPRGAPTGPRGHQNGVNGAGSQPLLYVTAEEEDSDASDEELEQRRREKKEAEQEKHYLDLERKWLNRERSKTGAIDREKARDDDEMSTVNRAKEAMAKQMKEFKDDSESTRRNEEYYRDRSSWVRNRQGLLKRERKLDEEDRMLEQREQAKHNPRGDGRQDSRSTVGAAVPDREQREQAVQPKFKISLGAAAQQRAQAVASSTRRTVAEVEGLLEDEEEEESTTKRTLVPLQYDNLEASAGLTEEERNQAVKELAADVPTTKEGLWAWDMKWEYVDEAVMQEQIRPFVEKKIMEYLGVQEEMLVDVVEEHIKNRGSPEELVSELEGPLDEEAEVFVMKLWRVLIFCTESEKRGLSA